VNRFGESVNDFMKVETAIADSGELRRSARGRVRRHEQEES